MAKLINLNRDLCVASCGGFSCIAIVDCSEIVEVIFKEERVGDRIKMKVAGFVMASVGAWNVYTVDDDDSSSYNQNHTRTNRKNTIVQQSTFKFSGLEDELLCWSDEAKECCCMVAVIFSNNCVNFVQGIEKDEKQEQGWKFSRKNAKAQINILTDTGDNEDRVEVVIESTASCFSSTTTEDITKEYFETI